MNTNQNGPREAGAKKSNIMEHILAVCGYVFFCILILAFTGMVTILGGLAGIFAMSLVLLGMAEAFLGLILVGIGIAHIFTLLRGSLVDIGLGLTLCSLGILSELFLFWLVLDAMPWIVGKIRKTKPKVMADDIRKYCKAVLKGCIAIIVAGTAFALVGGLMGGVEDIRKQVVVTLKQTRELAEDALEVLPFSASVRNVKFLSFEYADNSFSLKLPENEEPYEGDIPYTPIETTLPVKELRITVMSGIVNIMPTEEDCFAFQSSRSGEFRVIEEENVLTLDIYPHLQNYEGNEAQVILYVPKDCELEKFYLNFSGRAFHSTTNLRGKEATVLFPRGSMVSFDSLDFDTLKLQNGLGTLNVGKTRAGKLYTDVGRGNMNLMNCDLEDIRINVCSGNLYLEGLIHGNMELTCGTGKAELALYSFRKEEYTLDLTGTPGEMSIDGRDYDGKPLYYYEEVKQGKLLNADAKIGKIEIYRKE